MKTITPETLRSALERRGTGKPHRKPPPRAWTEPLQPMISAIPLDQPLTRRQNHNPQNLTRQHPGTNLNEWMK